MNDVLAVCGLIFCMIALVYLMISMVYVDLEDVETKWVVVLKVVFIAIIIGIICSCLQFLGVQLSIKV